MSSLHDSLQLQISQKRNSDEGAYLPSLVNPWNRICFKRFAYKRKLKEFRPGVFDFFCKFFFAKRHAAALVCYVSSTSEYGLLQVMSAV